MLALGLLSSSQDNHEEPEAPSPPNGEARTSIISDGARIEGLLDFTSVDLRIEGTVHGDISTDGRVVVAEGAEVQGTITARTARLAGNVEGRVVTTEELVLCPTSEVHATLEADTLEIQPGADFRGEVPETKQFVPEAEDAPSTEHESEELVSVSKAAQN